MRSQLRGSGMRRGGQMGSWFSDLVGSINLNPTYSPIWQSTVAPALDVGGVLLTGAPIGSLVTTAANAIDPSRQAAAPIYAPAPQPVVSTAAAPTPTAGAADDSTSKFILWGVLGVAVLGGGYMLYRASKKRAA